MTGAVGASVPRLEAPAKVTGASRYVVATVTDRAGAVAIADYPGGASRG